MSSGFCSEPQSEAADDGAVSNDEAESEWDAVHEITDCDDAHILEIAERVIMVITITITIRAHAVAR